jgi:hypothetical protein
MGGMFGMNAGVGIRVHAAELEHLEFSFEVTDAVLPEEDRSAGNDLNVCGDY